MFKLNVGNIDYCVQNIILVVSGTMASGKDTVLNLLKKDTDFYFVKSFTSRPKRKNERNSTHYKFISQVKFKKKIEKNEFLEYEELYGHFYGITKQEVLKALISRKPIIFRVDEQGADKIKKFFPQTKTVFIAPPSLKAIRERIVSRTNTSDLLIRERIKSAKKQLSALTVQEIYDYVIINRESRESVKELRQIFCSLKKI